MRAPKPGSILAVALLGLAIIFAMSLTVTYRPDLMSFFSLGWESGLIAEYEVHYSDGSFDSGTKYRPMSGVMIAGSDKPVTKILIRPVYKLNVPDRYKGMPGLVTYKYQIVVDNVPVYSEDRHRTLNVYREIPLGLVVITSEDLEKFGPGIHVISYRICDVSLTVGDYHVDYPGCKTLLSFTVRVGGEVFVTGGKDTPWRL